MGGFTAKGWGGTRVWFRFLLLVLFSLQLAVGVRAAASPVASPAPGPAMIPNDTLSPAEQAAQDLCVGVFLSYSVTTPPEKIPPFSGKLAKQPYKFGSTVTVTNLGYFKLDLWEVSIDFQYGEIISEADSGVLFLNGQTTPGLHTTSDTRIVGATLLTSIDTSHDLKLISSHFGMVATEFGRNATQFPLPNSMALVNKGYGCKANHSSPPSDLWVCCTENATALNTTNLQGNFLPRSSGDIIMSYDIISAFSSEYNVRVSIVMNDPIGRLDNWNLTWTWTGGELIKSMTGGQVLGSNEQDKCFYGIAAVQLAGEDFSSYQSCSPNPVIIDLDQYQSNSPEAIPYCCRNGTLLPDLIDPTKSRSDVKLNVKKLAPHNLLDDITPPIDWNIGDGYNCSQPVQVSPVEFDPAALHSSSSVASWQVVCNASTNVKAPKKCCVSFSAYYNDSLVPCPTCSCGCGVDKLPWNGEACNPYQPASLLPYQAVLLPPSNRTALAQQLANLHHRGGWSTEPCPDNCGVAINWHVYSDYTNGWSARMTLFNWDDQPVVNWSAAIQMPAAMPGFQDSYSFNNTLIPQADVKEFKDFNNTLFMQGRIDYSNNYLIGKDSTDNPGKLQSVLSFDKRKTPGIQVVQGDGFPTKVWFNGEECRIPVDIPTGDGWRLLPTFQFSIAIAVSIFLMVGDTRIFL